MSTAVAIDGGQTGLRLRCLPSGATGSAQGFSYQAGDGGQHATVAAVRSAAASAGLAGPVDVVCAGLSGAPADPLLRSRLAAGIAEALSAREVRLCPDMVTAHAGALGGSAGAVLAAGTGVVCLAIGPDGRTQRVDGCGHLFGDAGSAFAIGRAGLVAVHRAADGRSAATLLSELARKAYSVELSQLAQSLYTSPAVVSEVARFAPYVVEAAVAGDAVALEIVEQAAVDLAHTAATAARAVDVETVAYTGKLFAAGPVLLEPFTAELTRLVPDLDLRAAQGDPLDGAARLASGPLGAYEPLVTVYRHEHAAAAGTAGPLGADRSSEVAAQERERFAAAGAAVPLGADRPSEAVHEPEHAAAAGAADGRGADGSSEEAVAERERVAAVGPLGADPPPVAVQGRERVAAAGAADGLGADGSSEEAVQGRERVAAAGADPDPPFPRGSLIVSCQARPGNPLHGPEPMVLMAQAALAGGAAGIRANGPADIAAIRAAVDLPIIGIFKQGSPSGVSITPTKQAASDVVAAGAKIVALDGTLRPRPNGETLADQIAHIHALGALAMADVDSLESGQAARAAGADIVASTLSGYTGGNVPPGPDTALIAALVDALDCPIVAEGRYWTPSDVRAAFDLGAYAVVVGTAVTNPMAITQRLARAEP